MASVGEFPNTPNGHRLMRLDVYCRFPKCRRHSDGLVAHMDDGNAWQLTLLTLFTHTRPPHGNGHPLEVHVDGQPLQGGKHELRLVCTNGTCDRQGGREAVYFIEPELTGAAAIAFHAIHEGHPMTVFWDGVQIHPPAGSKQ